MKIEEMNMDEEKKESESTSSDHAMKPGSSKKQKLNQETTGNKRDFSNLPEDALLIIFSNFDMKEVIQICCLCKKMRNTWRTVPVLNFDLALWKIPTEEDMAAEGLLQLNHGSRFNAFVDRVLSLRAREGAKIDKLRLCSTERYKAEDFNHWIEIALQENVQEIEIYAHYYQEIVVNHSIFNSNVTVFKLEGNMNFENHFGYDRFKYLCLPMQMFIAERLTTLKLVQVALPTGYRGPNLLFVDSKLILKCPTLKELTLKDCCDAHLLIFVICAVKLMKLVIDNSYNRIMVNSKCVIQIVCENLVDFKYRGLMRNVRLTVDHNAIVDAAIYMVIVDSKKIPKIDIAEAARKVIERMPRVKSLTLQGLEVFVKNKLVTSLKDLLSPLTDLRHLKLLLSSHDSACIYGMAYLLQGCLSLETLTWKMIEDYYRVRSSKFTKIPQKFSLSHLIRSVEGQVVQGRDDELEFLTFLLENATGLEQMIIDTRTHWQMWGESMELLQFREKLPSRPRVEISFSD